MLAPCSVLGELDVMQENTDTNAEMRRKFFGVPRIPMRFLLDPSVRKQQRKVFEGWKNSAIFYRLFGLMNFLETPEGKLQFSDDEWLTIDQYLDAIRVCDWVPMPDPPSNEFMELEDDDLSSLIEPAKAALNLLDQKMA